MHRILNWQYSGGTLRDLRSNPKRVCCLGLACLFLAFLIAHSPTLANEQTPDPDAYEIVAVDADIDLRLIAQKYLNNPDLWPVVLQLNGLKDIDELASVQQLRLPVGPLSAAASALRRSLEAIQSANEAGAQLFAPNLVSKAIQLREEAVGEKNVGKYDSSISLSAKSICFRARKPAYVATPSPITRAKRMAETAVNNPRLRLTNFFNL